MPKYTFKLWDDDGGVEDDIGVNLPDADIAFRYACEVVSEMMNWSRTADSLLAAGRLRGRSQESLRDSVRGP